MARWDPGAADRLRQAALDLFVERGFENVTATEIAERAGLARRTFFRYFADKREVLFAGSEQLPPTLAEIVRDVPAGLAPIDVVLRSLSAMGAELTKYAHRARERRAVIAASPELRERDRTKAAALTDALTGALHDRGVAEPEAQLLAQVGGAIFTVAFGRWIEQGGDQTFPEVFDAAVGEVRAALI
jgi:AcrR family transcriptional regulator